MDCWRHDCLEFDGGQATERGLASASYEEVNVELFDDASQGLAADVAAGQLNHSILRAHRTGCRLTGTPE